MVVSCLVNPFSKTHGAPDDSERHVGDLGNFKTDAQGNAKGSVTDNLVKLIGPESVLGVCLLFFPLSCHIHPKPKSITTRERTN